MIPITNALGNIVVAAGAAAGTAAPGSEATTALREYVWLCEAIAAIAASMCKESIKGIEVLTCGALASQNAAPLIEAALLGALSTKLENVNRADAQKCAQYLGIGIRDSKSHQTKAFRDEVSAIVFSEHELCAVRGAIVSQDKMFIHLGYDWIRVTEGPHLLLIVHGDQSSATMTMVGDLLRRNNFNTSNMAEGRVKAGQQSVIITSLSKPVPEPLIKEIAAHAGIQNAHCFSLVGTAG